MGYTKNHDPWASGDLLTTTVLNNFETIYEDITSPIVGHLYTHDHDALYPRIEEMDDAYWHAGNDGPGSGSDADLLYRSSGNLHASAFAGMGVPTGLVVLWYGSVASIPSGWHLCDGTSGTIDLRGRFTVGAGTGAAYFSVGGTGGSSSFTATGSMTISGHALTITEMPAHNHPYTDAMWNLDWEWGSTSVGSPSTDVYSTRTSPSAGGGAAHTHGGSVSVGSITLLPYAIALCYIQKI